MAMELFFSRSSSSIFASSIVSMWSMSLFQVRHHHYVDNHNFFAEMIPTGSRAVLNCSYTVSPGQFMDSVKWYLNTSEIYRIVPSLTKDRLVIMIINLT